MATRRNGEACLRRGAGACSKHAADEIDDDLGPPPHVTARALPGHGERAQAVYLVLQPLPQLGGRRQHQERELHVQVSRARVEVRRSEEREYGV
jgi:hypothetical protein